MTDEDPDTEFSPPAWGWTDERHYLDPSTSVFPTRVGMDRRL